MKNLMAPEHTLVKFATAAVSLLAAAVILYSLFLLVVGERRLVVPEGANESSTQFVPFLPALIPLLAGILLIAGLLTQRLLVAWIGLALLVTFSSLFLFGNGGIFLPFAVLILLALVLIHTQRLLLIWILLIGFLVISVLLNFPPAILLLSAGAIGLFLLTFFLLLRSKQNSAA